jgi:molecular chaperone Hsp33
MDQLHRFLFEDLGVRGELVQLGASWRVVRDNQDYPATVATQLGQGLAGVMLLSGTIKFSGSLILQIQSSGPLNLLVAQATDQRTLRGLARWQEEVPVGDLAATFGQGRLVITAEAPSGERYQGIVALEGSGLAEAIGTYFQQSEQLPTRLWLACDGEHAAGLFLQRLPGQQVEDADAWERLTALADTVTVEELASLPVEQLLHRLFHEETLRLFEPEPVAYRCGCSRERIAEVLRAMGEGEVSELVQSEGEIHAGCEFCGRDYVFDKVDVAALFSGAAPLPAEDSTTH